MIFLVHLSLLPVAGITNLTHLSAGKHGKVPLIVKALGHSKIGEEVTRESATFLKSISVRL